MSRLKAFVSVERVTAAYVGCLVGKKLSLRDVHSESAQLQTAPATDLTPSPVLISDRCPDSPSVVVQNTRAEVQTESKVIAAAQTDVFGIQTRRETDSLVPKIIALETELWFVFSWWRKEEIFASGCFPYKSISSVKRVTARFAGASLLSAANDK